MAAIYNHYITNTTVTFELEAVSAAEMRSRLERLGGRFPWLVAVREGEVVGYAYAGMLKDRRAYDRSVETSVYMATGSRQQGLGSELYTALLAELAGRGVHTAIGILTLPNPASVAFHNKFGFKQVAQAGVIQTIHLV
jgi:phosphinothricin acetyltransferase